MVGKDSIILGFRYDDYYSNGLTDKQWSRLRKNQLDLISNIIDKLMTDKNLDIPINIIKYDDFSVNQGENKEEER